MTPEYTAYKAAIEKQNKIVTRKQALADKQRDILKQMLQHCTHEEVEAKSSYDSGSYYNKASTDHWNQCKLCGKRSEVITETHSYYG